MKALIFVYTNAQFRITGFSSIRQFPFRSTSFDLAPEVAPGRSGEVTLAKGIYAMFTDNIKVRLEITTTSGTPSTDFDVLVIDDKTIWPDPKLTTDALCTRVYQAFPELVDWQLNSFALDDKGM